MLQKLRELLTGQPQPESSGIADEQQLRTATAALLVEMSRADFAEQAAEREELLRILQQHFSLQLGDAEALLKRATRRADKAVSLHEFTSLLHQQLEVEEKQAIVELLWRVALSDAELNKYEDHLVRKVSELLYLPHSDLMRLKHRVLGELDDQN